MQLYLFKMLTVFQCVATVVDSETTLLRASDLRNNFLQLKDMGLLPAWSSTLHIPSEINA